MKSIIKEICIILLLCIAICLVLAVIFYDYIPTNKVVPSTVEAYKTSNTIKDEINQEIVDYPKQNITFEITDSDLTLHRQENSYDSGKANPFAPASAGVGNTATNVPAGNTTIDRPATNSNPDSTDHFFNSTGGIK